MLWEMVRNDSEEGEGLRTWGELWVGEVAFLEHEGACCEFILGGHSGDCTFGKQVIAEGSTVLVEREISPFSPGLETYLYILES